MGVDKTNSDLMDLSALAETAKRWNDELKSHVIQSAAEN